MLAFGDASLLGMEDGTSSGAGICIGEICGSARSLPPNSDCLGLDALEEWVLSSWGSSSDIRCNPLGALSLGLGLALLGFPPVHPLSGMV